MLTKQNKKNFLTKVILLAKLCLACVHSMVMSCVSAAGLAVGWVISCVFEHGMLIHVHSNASMIYEEKPSAGRELTHILQAPSCDTRQEIPRKCDH